MNSTITESSRVNMTNLLACSQTQNSWIASMPACKSFS